MHDQINGNLFLELSKNGCHIQIQINSIPVRLRNFFTIGYDQQIKITIWIRIPLVSVGSWHEPRTGRSVGLKKKEGTTQHDKDIHLRPNTEVHSLLDLKHRAGF